MMKGHRNGALAAAGSVLLLAGCAAHSAPASMVDASRASRLAGELAAAEAAFDAGDDKALAAAVMRIDRRSARPLDTGREDLLPFWRDRVRDAVPPLRGRALGPGYVRGTLAPGAATSMMQLFLSGQPATIAANSNPSKGLRLKIYEADGKLVCDRRPAQSGDCRFTPVFTQRYRIELSNGGAGSARYYLVID
jgi:hypothetical protein